MSRVKYSKELEKRELKREISKQISEMIKIVLVKSNKKQKDIYSLGSHSTVSRKINDPLKINIMELIDLSYEFDGFLKIKNPLELNIK